MKEKLLEMLKELKEDLVKQEKYDTDGLGRTSAINLIAAKAILDQMKEGKTLVEASSKVVRSYDDALAKCLDEGQKADDEFMYDFTTNYLNSMLGILSCLFVVPEFAKDRENRAFLKSKVREALIYIDRL